MPRPEPGRPRTLLTDADRERLVALLREHYAQGSLSLDELRRRVGIVLAAEYSDEAMAAVADLPLLAGGRGAATGSGRPGGPRVPIGQRRRHGEAAAPGAGWTPTPERFRDPSTKKIMRVWIDPADGSRHYVPDDG
jgi:hypothetical protein